MMWIITLGNPASGFVFIGPFNCFEDALEHAEQANYKVEWSICQLDQP